MTLHAAIEQLYNQCRVLGWCDVLCDPQANERIGEWVAALDEEVAPRIFLRDPLFADSPQDAPVLVRLPMSEVSRLEEWATHAQQEALDVHNPLRSVCAFIGSDLPIERLALRLTQALDLKVDGKGIYFRYFDPRVFHHLPRLLSAEDFEHLFRGVSIWSYFSWDGSLTALQISAASDERPGRLNLTSKEWHPFETIEHFNSTQRFFAKQGLPFEPARTVDLFAQVHAARSLGLAAPDDTAYYLVCSYQSTQPLSQHPAWPDVISLLKQDVPLADALAQLCQVSLPPARPLSPLQPEQPS
jgi:hypothetical protein